MRQENYPATLDGPAPPGVQEDVHARNAAGLLVRAMMDAEVDHLCGVPDSGLQAFMAEARTHWRLQYAPREDVAVGSSIGAAVAGRRAAVFMKNAGLGTSLDALLSGVRAARLPLLLVVGWAGVAEDTLAHHVVMGAVTLPLLSAVGIPWLLLERSHAVSAADISTFVRAGFECAEIRAVVVQP